MRLIKLLKSFLMWRMSEQPESQSNPTPDQVSQRAQAEALQKIVTQKAPDIINAVPAEKRPRLFQIVQESIRFRSGPLPDPADLAAYNAVIPNGADRIMKMAEAQSTHRMELEKL